MTNVADLRKDVVLCHIKWLRHRGINLEQKLEALAVTDDATEPLSPPILKLPSKRGREEEVAPGRTNGVAPRTTLFDGALDALPPSKRCKFADSQEMSLTCTKVSSTHAGNARQGSVAKIPSFVIRAKLTDFQRGGLGRIECGKIALEDNWRIGAGLLQRGHTFGATQPILTFVHRCHLSDVVVGLSFWSLYGDTETGSELMRESQSQSMRQTENAWSPQTQKANGSEDHSHSSPSGSSKGRKRGQSPLSDSKSQPVGKKARHGG
ncbi:hypothetical protein C8F04DRAFT_1177735 [Mycena alexandri]|uniref:Uncharacterized protein n=1 Tax=Mycena alexandri TaxID=1745969 RepID=A0AAD6T7S6_9AGAR|nr:hypothetical protein C8F04DRAFT_1177735 [Mycena alexandri]